MAKYDWIDVKHQQVQELIALKQQIKCDPGYMVLSQDELPSVISAALQAKCPEALLMSSTTANDTTILVCNLYRVDQKDFALDQQPFAVAVTSTSTASSGLFIQHGNWDGRTNYNVPQAFWDIVAASGVGAVGPTIALPSNNGPFSDLQGFPDEKAFMRVITQFQKAGII